MVRILQTVGALLALASSAGLVLADEKAETRARNDYLLHCSGCHGQDGMGKPEKGIPRFEGQVGYFLRVPEGRAFLMQVPGLLSANLSDERAAAVTSWMIRRFAGPSLPGDFVSYTADEAARYRRMRPADITSKRHQLYAELLSVGYPLK